MQPIERAANPTQWNDSVATISTPYSRSVAGVRSSRDLAEVIFGFALIMLIIWLPQSEQLLLSPVAFFATFSIVFTRRLSLQELGLGTTGLVSSSWILPAAAGLVVITALIAHKFGILHPLYQADFRHVAGYVLWTCYQQFLLQDYFMPRLSRLFASDLAAVTVTAILFSVAHLPNLPLAAVTLVWGAISCLLFRHHKSLYVLGLAQGLLGLGFAICVPDALHHHMRVGLGYLRYLHAH